MYITVWLNSVATKYGVERFKYIETMNKEIKTGNTHGNGDLAVVSSRFLNEPITHAALVLLGYKHHVCDYYCPPYPAHGATYRLEYKATHFKGGKPVEGTEEWRAYLTHSDLPTIRRFKTLGELRDFHKGMCGGVLF